MEEGIEERILTVCDKKDCAYYAVWKDRVLDVLVVNEKNIFLSASAVYRCPLCSHFTRPDLYLTK